MLLSRRGLIQAFSAVGYAAVLPTARGLPGLAAILGGQALSERVPLHILTAVPIEDVTIEDEFWSEKRDVWRAVTLWDSFKKFEEEQGGGAISNFDRVRDGLTGGHVGAPWNDGLIYEMIRAASDFLRSQPDADIDAKLDDWIERIAAAQAHDEFGYLNTYTQLGEPSHRWGLNGGLEIWQHELYNLGALVDAGVHHYRATGKVGMLKASVKAANLLTEEIGPHPRKELVPGHEIGEEALLGMYLLFQEQPNLKAKLGFPVDEARYLKLAEFWVENRGRNIGKPDWIDHAASEKFVREYRDYANGRPSWGAYAQDDKPVFEQNEVVGHAVRATLFLSAVAALARVNHRPAYAESAKRLWENMVFRKMHVTGGVGAFADEEKFGPDYVLPNDAYLETCAAVGAAFFHQNMNLLFGDARYMDEFERVLYNGALAGVSVAGDTYFYRNPLIADESRERWQWNDCPCCPPMFLKLMSAMPGAIYAKDEDSLYVNLFVGSKARVEHRGVGVTLRQITRYPWDGHVTLEIDPDRKELFAVAIRMPAWCYAPTIRVNGKPFSAAELRHGYVRVKRSWAKGDRIEIELPMAPETIAADPKVMADQGRAAIRRGPLIYCVESTDGNPSPESIDLSHPAELRDGAGISRLGGIVPVEVHTAGQTIEAVPYYANANRGPVKMAVWLRRNEE